MTRSCSTDRTTGGFTLIEVLVAITLLSLVLTAVYGVFTSLSATEKRLHSDSEAYHQARIIFGPSRSRDSHLLPQHRQ